jgi:DNA-binding LacI/PurR family transcriptional regulator
MSKRDRITAHQIAAMAGVSQPTVSRALRGDTRVNEDTRLKIVELANRLNYTVDHNALRLRTQQSLTIALVVLCRKGENKANINPFYLSLLGCIAASASDHGYNLIVSFQESPTNFFANYVGSRQADGLIVIGSGQNVEGWQFFSDYAKHETPMICWGASEHDLVTVQSDNRHGAKLAVDHLLDQNCRKIVYVGPSDSQQPQFKDRLVGYLDIMKHRGLEPICPRLPENAVREAQGYAAITGLIRDNVEFDGIFAGNDFIALGAMRALDEHHISVPAQVKVIGFDGIATGAYAQPPLTTIEQDYRRAGEMLVKALIAILKGEEPQMEPVPVRLLERSST